MGSKIIDKNHEQYKPMMGILKPSELCHVMFFEDVHAGLFAYLTPLEIDLINIILYKSREQIVKYNKTLDTGMFSLELSFNEIASILSKYKSTGYESLVQHFRNIRNKEVVINALNKNRELEVTYTSFIHKIKEPKLQKGKPANISIEVDSTIVDMVIDVEERFSIMFLKIQFGLNSKYSKLLYEILRDYLGKDYKFTKSKIIDYDLLLGLLNVKNLKRYSKFSFFNGEIIKKAIKEINEYTDIKVSYEPIKERPEGQRLQVTKIKFMMEKQSDSRLEELGILDAPPKLSMEEQLNQGKMETKSRIKLDNLVNNQRYNVVDEDAWIATDVEKNKEMYKAQILLDDYFMQLDANETERHNIMESLAIHFDIDDPVVLINGYILTDMSGTALTSSAIGTRKVIQKLQEEENI
jgi:plasmid replication initiation protein